MFWSCFWQLYSILWVIEFAYNSFKSDLIVDWLKMGIPVGIQESLIVIGWIVSCSLLIGWIKLALFSDWLMGGAYLYINPCFFGPWSVFLADSVSLCQCSVWIKKFKCSSSTPQPAPTGLPPSSPLPPLTWVPHLEAPERFRIFMTFCSLLLPFDPSLFPSSSPQLPSPVPAPAVSTLTGFGLKVIPLLGSPPSPPAALLQAVCVCTLRH